LRIVKGGRIGVDRKRGRLSDPDDLAGRGRHQTEPQVADPLGQALGQLHPGKTVGENLVLLLLLALANLLAELKNLVLLEDVAGAKPADERTEQDRLERRHKTNGSGLIATIVGHED
jgi:hypothetical protein